MLNQYRHMNISLIGGPCLCLLQGLEIRHTHAAPNNNHEQIKALGYLSLVVAKSSRRFKIDMQKQANKSRYPRYPQRPHLHHHRGGLHSGHEHFPPR
jgi:hypothetical protein